MNYKKAFIKLAIEKNALKFGSFKLKSERVSPYFFNSGVFSDGKSLSIISKLLLQLIIENKLQFENIFGTAYKGIPLASALSSYMALKNMSVTNFIYDRKDEKKYGEKGDIVGTFKSGKTLIVDDVITAGTAIKSTINKLKKYNVKINALLVLFDRQEVGTGRITASEEIKKNYDINIFSLMNISDIIDFISKSKNFEKIKGDIINYKNKYSL